MLVTYSRNVNLSRCMVSDRVTKGEVSCQERTVKNCVVCTTIYIQPDPGLKRTPHFSGETPASCFEGEGIRRVSRTVNATSVSVNPNEDRKLACRTEI